MTPGAVLLLVAGPAVAYLVVATVAVVRRGGRGPGDPPASHLRIDPAGFPVLPAPRALRRPRTVRAGRRPAGWLSARASRLLLRAPRRATAP